MKALPPRSKGVIDISCYEILEGLKNFSVAYVALASIYQKKEDIQAAAASYASRVGKKLRREGLAAGK